MLVYPKMESSEYVTPFFFQYDAYHKREQAVKELNGIIEPLKNELQQ